jgi:hypothetical protein
LDQDQEQNFELLNELQDYRYEVLMAREEQAIPGEGPETSPDSSWTGPNLRPEQPDKDTNRPAPPDPNAQGRMTYNVPPMRVDSASNISLAITHLDTSITYLLRKVPGLRDSTQQELISRIIDIGPYMLAELEEKGSGDNFAIELLGGDNPVRQVDFSRGMRLANWIWEVTPRKAGRHDLRLTVSIMDGPSPANLATLATYVVFDTTIQVMARPQPVEPEAPAEAGWLARYGIWLGILLLLLLAGAGWWFWRRRGAGQPGGGKDLEQRLAVLDDPRAKIRLLVEEAELERALEMLGAQLEAKDPDLYNQWLVQKSRWNQFEKDYAADLLDKDEIRLARGRTRQAILELLEEV